MRRSRARAAFAAAAVLSACLASVVPAEAAHVVCGQVITQDVTLHGDVGPCPNNGIIVDADNVTLNLNGYRVRGTPDTGDGGGIIIDQQHGVTVLNGTVSDFDGGVAIIGGGENHLNRLLVVDNIGASEGHPPAPSTRFGEGIAVEGSSNNLIHNSVVRNNGPFAGIGLYEVPDSDHTFPPAPTTGNRVQNNLVEDNTACRRGPFCDNIGIRLEPQVGPDNVVTRNTVRRNGLDGISLFRAAARNTISRNTIEANGFVGAVAGDGIRVFGFENVIEQNSSVGNARDGISVGRRSIAPPGSLPAPGGRSNQILRNTTARNGNLDLWDSNRNPDCDNNVWSGNTFQTAAPPCTTAS